MKIFISQPIEIEGIRGQITAALKEKYGNDIEIIDSFFKNAPNGAKPLWFLGESLKKLSEADIAVFAYENSIDAVSKRLARGCSIEEKCAKEYDILCLYVSYSFWKNDKSYYIGNLSAKRPNFTEWWNGLHRSLGKAEWEEGQAAGCDDSHF